MSRNTRAVRAQADSTISKLCLQRSASAARPRLGARVYGSPRGTPGRIVGARGPPRARKTDPRRRGADATPSSTPPSTPSTP